MKQSVRIGAETMAATPAAANMEGQSGWSPFESKLNEMHEQIEDMVHMGRSIGRIAVAVYDQDSDRLSTFAISDRVPVPLKHYSAQLSDIPSLRNLGRKGGYRVIDDMAYCVNPEIAHSWIIAQSYQSSLTSTIKKGDSLYGFLFMDAGPTHFFTDEVVGSLLPYAQLISALAVIELDGIRVLKAAILTARDIGHFRDNETGSHLDRMSAYTRIIATTLAPSLGKDDVWVETLSYLAPMHDIGKVAVPDAILFKPAKLDPEEFEVIKGHVGAGMNIVEVLLKNFDVPNNECARILRTIVRCHHETLDGQGYPGGLSGGDVPIEAMIVSVADIFDALTSERPYKKAWSIQEAVDYLVANKGPKFSPECVDALVANLDKIEAIRERITE